MRAFQARQQGGRLLALDLQQRVAPAVRLRRRREHLAHAAVHRVASTVRSSGGRWRRGGRRVEALQLRAPHLHQAMDRACSSYGRR